jgi:hypothetical protein
MSNMSFFREVPAPVVIDDPVEVEAFLAATIGVTTEELHVAVQHGAADAALVTEHSAAASFGWRMFDGTLTSIRDQWVVRGWRAARPGGLEVVVRKDNGLQITPSMGTEDTGIREGHPTCKHDRGAASAVAIEENQSSFGEVAHGDAAWERIRTWWLMYCIAVRGDEKFVRAELSLPLRVENGRITEWGYRVLLGERLIGSAAVVAIPEAAPEPTIPELRRRAEG